ncbi:MAG: acyltransferase family protein [Clostridiales bacterium]|nr:acyltransferase family protein [Clostridiales bacterium]
MRKKRKGRTSGKSTATYYYLFDNMKMVLIFLVVFNHLNARALVSADTTANYIRCAINIFHMPAFIFVSGYLSKKPQDALKNVKNLLIPYVLGYSLAWYAYVYGYGHELAYNILKPIQTPMWYLLALLFYRLTIEAVGKLRFAVPLLIVFALWAGTRAEFGNFLSVSRIVVFFPFFVAGYLWKSEYIDVVRRFRGKWILIPIAGFMLYAIPNYMISNGIPQTIFRGNSSYELCELTLQEGIILRLLVYLVSFTVILALLALLPNRKLLLSFMGRNTMTIYLFHVPIMYAMDGMGIFDTPQMMNLGAIAGLALVFSVLLGSPPVAFLYRQSLRLLGFIFFRSDRKVRDEGLEEEYDTEFDDWEFQNRIRALDSFDESLEEDEDFNEFIRNEEAEDSDGPALDEWGKDSDGTALDEWDEDPDGPALDEREEDSVGMVLDEEEEDPEEPALDKGEEDSDGNP